MEAQLRAMARSSSTVISCKALLLLSLISASSGFNINTSHNGSGNRVRRMPPLFYTDIEPEIRSMTVPPPVIDFNGTNNNLRKTDNDAHDESNILTKEKNSSCRRKPSKRTKNKSTTTTAMTASPSSNNKGKKTHDSVWHRHYADLQQYKEKYGNCLVPQNYADNRKLGLWVMQQRRQYTLMQQGKNSSLSGKRGDYRLQLLEDIGFVWRLDRRGPRGSYGVLRRASDQAEHETHTVANFEEYMLEKCSDYTDDEKRDVWLKRFEILR